MARDIDPVLWKAEWKAGSRGYIAGPLVFGKRNFSGRESWREKELEKQILRSF